jgi:GNAT superfamily N-acetyltransferase
VGSAVATLRAARPADHDRSRELTFESKSHRGYDRDFVRGWADGLSFERDQERWVVELDDEIVAWAGLMPPAGGVAVLDHLWVDPAWMGHGFGTRLFRRAADRGRELGASRLEWGAEQHALAFYEKMGGRFMRNFVTEWGREGKWWGMAL